MPLFVSMTAGGPPDQVTRRAAHPVARKGINDSPSKVIPTNNFYGNLMLGNQNQGVWTHPYSLRWVKGTGNSSSWGFGVSHIERSQFAYGPGNPNKYFIAPLGITSIILSAQELSNSTALTTDSLEAFSVNANLAVSAQSGPLVTFPLVQGMGFFTGVYLGATALIQTDVFFRTLSGPWTLGTSLKYKVLLEDGRTWLFYVHSSQGYVNPQFILRSNTTIQGPSGFRGSIQVAKLPEGQSNAESWYDWAAGVYPVTGATFGTFNNGSASYTLSWQKGGDTGKTLIMWALPHHIQSFNGGVGAAATDVQLYTTTKGQATLVASDQWVMVEKLVTDMGFTPWTPQNRSVTTLPEKAIVAINSVASSELNQDFAPQTNLDSMYFSGKGLAKFAAILIAVNDLARNPGLAAAGLSKLKTAFNNFVQNTQKSPLVYDQIFKGVISTAGYSDPGADFGNTYYNDHHFHYGYFVYTAAVIAHLDPSWLNQGTNLQWVQTLVQDFASPVADERFPFSRAFDWFHGHSWAKGLFESADGKDQESTSEDAFASYALKLWGRVIGDAALEARGDLMLAIQARTFQNYFLMDSSNKIQPASFIENKVTGILFENKVDHATYFSADIECIQGIHMIPIMPPSTLIRSKAFVTEEWNKYFSNGRVDSIPGGWRGILYANLAIINPKASYDFFAQPNFDPSWLDGGASRTWYLAYAAALGGCT
ncbi:glycoside hydrolase family 81 protein [Patellaria atrata CBS 101060]|uniref:glucan endo-1,3-beta-D-glucosidase n=1 Tax=Patellaria atrata CBS 101060 TaxID=1346257 RepID=A0A9P4VQC9_9PEZI|nr:glycoside hydrolase family 81 protein [Patellaria atrata CBS 101060]